MVASFIVQTKNTNSVPNTNLEEIKQAARTSINSEDANSLIVDGEKGADKDFTFANDFVGEKNNDSEEELSLYKQNLEQNELAFNPSLKATARSERNLSDKLL